MRKSWQTRLRLIVLVFAASGAVLICSLLLLFQHIPSWYRPVVIAPADVQVVKNDLLQMFENFTMLAKTGQPFEYRLSAEQINAWLAVREEMWPLSREWLLPSLSNPMVTIEEGAIRLAATYREGGLKTVASMRFTIAGDANGIYIGLTDVVSGSLPVPVSWVRREVAKLDTRLWPTGKIIRGEYAGRVLPALDDLFEEATFSNEWIWTNGHIPFRIAGLRAEEGALVLNIEPLPRQADSR